MFAGEVAAVLFAIAGDVCVEVAALPVAVVPPPVCAGDTATQISDNSNNVGMRAGCISR